MREIMKNGKIKDNGQHSEAPTRISKKSTKGSSNDKNYCCFLLQLNTTRRTLKRRLKSRRSINLTVSSVEWMTHLSSGTRPKKLKRLHGDREG
jgi:hypothetical protein